MTNFLIKDTALSFSQLSLMAFFCSYSTIADTKVVFKKQFIFEKQIPPMILSKMHSLIIIIIISNLYYF
jgi:hypothetical protein